MPITPYIESEHEDGWGFSGVTWTEKQRAMGRVPVEYDWDIKAGDWHNSTELDGSNGSNWGRT